jgi:hypothetical protein
MTQISRPFQIALAVLVLFVAVWFLALRGHSSSGSSSEPSTPAVSAAAPAASASSGSSAAAARRLSAQAKAVERKKAAERKAHHAATPSAGGLKHTIVKAQGTAKHSATPAHGTSAARTSAAVKSAPKSATSPKAAAAPSSAKPHAAAPAKASGAPANTQKVVEAELKQGKVVAVLFWNPKGTVDGVVHREVQAVSHASHGGVIVHVARATEIGAFGSFTRAVQVYATPTILLINKQGQTSSLSGLTDVFGIEQAVREVKRAK